MNEKIYKIVIMGYPLFVTGSTELFYTIM